MMDRPNWFLALAIILLTPLWLPLFAVLLAQHALDVITDVDGLRRSRRATPPNPFDRDATGKGTAG